MLVDKELIFCKYCKLIIDDVIKHVNCLTAYNNGKNAIIMKEKGSDKQ
jgi:hypothetical protein